MTIVKKDDRLFAPFPIEMDEHPKIAPLSDAAFRALFEATFYSRRMLSDGFLDERIVLKRWGQTVADELSSNDPERPSWIRVERGWQIHDFEKHHPLKAQIDAGREARRAAGSKGGVRSGEVRGADHDGSKPEADAKQSGSKTNPESESESESESSKASPSGKKPNVRLPDDWVPNAAHYERATTNRLDIAREVESFRLHAQTHDRHAASWNAAFTTWLMKAKPAKGGGSDWALRM